MRNRFPPGRDTGTSVLYLSWDAIAVILNHPIPKTSQMDETAYYHTQSITLVYGFLWIFITGIFMLI